jgi:hypothetical protein
VSGAWKKKERFEMLTSSALMRCFTRAGIPCLLAAYASTAASWQADEDVVSQELVRAVTLRRIDLPAIYPAGTGSIVLVRESSLPRVRACDAVARLFPSSASFRFVFSPTARYLATAVDGGLVYVWDLLACRTLPPLEIAGLAGCAFAPAFVGDRATPRLLLASSAGLAIATFAEAGPAERIHGIEGQWYLTFKPAETPLGGLTVHTLSGQVALLTQKQDQLALWDLATLCGPRVCTLDGREGSETGPRCVHVTGLCNPLIAYHFTPDGRQVVLLRADGQLTVHPTDRPGLQENLGALTNPQVPEAPLALALDGRRLAVAGPCGLQLWERASLRDPFGLPRTTADPEQTFGAGDVLEFTHRGDPVVLDRVGTVHWYEWERASKRAELPLAESEEVIAPARIRRHWSGECR